MLDAVVNGLLLGLYLAISVGPIVFTVIKQSLDNGWRGGLAFILGIFSVDLFLVILCNSFAHLFSILLKYERPIGIVGSILLIGAGIYFLFYKRAETAHHNGKVIKVKANSYYGRLFLTGLIMNAVNPGIIVVWFTAATAFSTYSFAERITIFSTALFIALAADVAKVLLADKLRQKLTLHNIQRINKVNGLIVLVFGIVLLCLLLANKSIGH